MQLVKVIDMDRTEGPEELAWSLLDRRQDKVNKGVVIEEGLPYAKLQNLVTVLTHDSRWKGRIRFNEFAGEVELDGDPITDSIDCEVAIWLDKVYSINAQSKSIHEAINTAAQRQPYHPVRSYLDRLKWDSSPRVEQLLSHYMGAEGSQLHAAISKCFLVSCVARIYKPGCKVDTTLILQGKQGARKSTAFATLCKNREWFSDTALDLRNKDSRQALPGVWIYEMAELDGIRPREASTVKAFLSNGIDRYRPSYGRRMIRWPRQTVFVGTTNEQAFLSDNTGSRRFWVAQVGDILLEELAKDVDQLWAEAVFLYKRGEQWWLDEEHTAPLQEASEPFQQVDSWEDAINEYINSKQTNGILIGDVLTRAINMDLASQTKQHTMRVAGIMQKLGWKKKRVRDRRGKRTTRWFPST